MMRMIGLRFKNSILLVTVQYSTYMEDTLNDRENKHEMMMIPIEKYSE